MVSSTYHYLVTFSLYVKEGAKKKKKKALEIKIIKIWAIGRKTGGVTDTRSSRDS